MMPISTDAIEAEGVDRSFKICGSLAAKVSYNVGAVAVNQWMSTSATNSKRLVELSCANWGRKSVADFSINLVPPTPQKTKVNGKEKRHKNKQSLQRESNWASTLKCKKG